MRINGRESIIALTPLWNGERFPDGRPKVTDKYLDALYGMTLDWSKEYDLSRNGAHNDAQTAL